MPDLNPWWTRLMSGTDNQTPAIGRYLALALFVFAIIVVPTVLLFALYAKLSDIGTAAALLSALCTYVISITGSCVVLIRVTNSTEPGKDGPA